MTKYKKYPTLKQSQIAWVGEIPNHWQVKRLRFVASPHNSNVDKKEHADEVPVSLCNYTDVYYNEFIVSGLPFMRSTASKSDVDDFTLRSGDVIITKDSEEADDIGIAAYVTENLPGIVCGYHLSILRAFGVSGRFLFRLIQSQATRSHFFVEVSGVTRFGLGQDAIKNTPVLIPPHDEQHNICDRIDRETARIDALIEKKTRFIELLKEKRKALILHTVTKGLDPTVKIKDSGIEWLGYVPEHWRILSLARVSLSRCDGPFGTAIKSEHYAESGVRVIRLQNIAADSFNDEDKVFLSEDHVRNNVGDSHTVVADDLLIAGLGDQNNPLGRACLAPNGLGTSIVKADCYRFRLDTKVVHPPFIAAQLAATATIECGFMSTGSTRDRLNLGLASTRKIALPPTLLEQQSITLSIHNSSKNIDSLIEKTDWSIALLRERRAALISAAVTGQIDVRGDVA